MNNLPDYKWRPSLKSLEPEIRTCSNRRSRLYAGGTYFRSKELGRRQNNISISVIEFAPPSDQTPNGICIVQNYNLDASEQVVGDVEVVTLELNLKQDEYIEIDQLDTPQPRARRNSISRQIAPGNPVVVEELPFQFGKLFVVPGKVTASLKKTKQIYTADDKIVLKPRVRVYHLAVANYPASGEAPAVTGWDIANLRSQIAADPWIEMPNRPSASNALDTPAVNADVQDEGSDAQLLTPFDEQRLIGADGTPATPNDEKTGPTRALLHLNYEEQDDGSLKETNVVFEWAGDTNTDGVWRRWN